MIEQLKELRDILNTKLNDPITGDCTEPVFPFIFSAFNELEIRNVLEIGFNRGSSATMMLLSSDDISVTSFDIRNPLPNTSISFLMNRFPGRFKYFDMDSKKIRSLPDMANKFDLIFIDGDHSEQGFLTDLETSINLNPKYIMIDDIDHRGHPYIGDIARMDHDKLHLLFKRPNIGIFEVLK